MLAQELSSTHPELRDVCQEYFSRLAKDLAQDLAEAKTLHAPDADFDPQNVAMLYVSMMQGPMMLAKTAEANTVLMENVEQFRRYISWPVSANRFQHHAKNSNNRISLSHSIFLPNSHTNWSV